MSQNDKALRTSGIWTQHVLHFFSGTEIICPSYPLSDQISFFQNGFQNYRWATKGILCQQSGPNGYPIPDPNPKFLSIPEPDPIFFQNHRVFRVSGIPENFNFCINLMCRLFNFWPVSFKATYILGQYNKAHQVGAILHVFMPKDRSSSALHLTTTMFTTLEEEKIAPFAVIFWKLSERRKSLE